MTEIDSEESAKAEAATADAEAKAEPEAAAAKPSAEDDAAQPEGDAAEAPKRKKKRKKREREDATPGARPALDAAGRDRPTFLLEFPVDPELEPLIRAFENGNYAQVRADAPRLAERSSDAAVKAAAEELLRRIEPDPLVKFLLGVAIALFCAVVGYVYFSQ